MGGKGRRSVNNKNIISCCQCKMQIKEKDNFIECDNCHKILHSQLIIKIRLLLVIFVKLHIMKE